MPKSKKRPPPLPLDRDQFDWIKELTRSRVEKHYGPGPHPGTGTPQAVHGGEFQKPKIYVGADEVEPGQSPRDYPLNMGGNEFISVNDPRVPDRLYHVTTNMSSVKTTGLLKASLDNQGLGGGSKDRHQVSLTASKEIADGLLRDLKLVGTFYKKFGLNPIDVRHGVSSKEEIKAWNTKAYRFLRLQARKQGWRYRSSRYQHEFALAGDTSKSMINDFFSHRESWAQDKFDGWPVPERYRNPLFFTTAASLARIDPDNVGVVTVTKKMLAQGGAAVLDFDLGGGSLEEISYFGDILLTS